MLLCVIQAITIRFKIEEKGRYHVIAIVTRENTFITTRLTKRSVVSKSRKNK